MEGKQKLDVRAVSPTLEEVEGYLHETHSDPLRDEPLGQCPNELKVDPPEALMDVSEPTWQELKEVVEKARSGSAPGPNIVYKRCPMLPISHQRALYAACVTRPLVRDCNVTSEVMAAFPCNLEERDNTGMLEKG